MCAARRCSTWAAEGFYSRRLPQVPPQALAGEGQAYWQDFLDYPTFVAIEAFAPPPHH